MANIMDYVKLYKNKSFDEIHFNDVDALVLAELAYLPLSNFLKTGVMPITIKSLADMYFSKIKEEDMKGRAHIYRDSYHLFKEMMDTKRFKNLVITNYKNIVDDKKQFGAITYRYEKKFSYIVFEGTDSSIVGWKEDFEMAHTFPVPSQKLAYEYLNNEVKLTDHTVFVGGHSKGGNLALVSVMKSLPFVRHRVKTIYNFDGPGLRLKEYHSISYEKIKHKVKTFVPGLSVVGMLLNHDLNYQVVKSSAKNFKQHDAITWECFGEVFIEDELSKKSIIFSQLIKTFVDNMSHDECVEFVDGIFDVFEKAGITDTESINLSKIVKCLSCISDIRANKNLKEKLKALFGILVKMYSS